MKDHVIRQLSGLLFFLFCSTVAGAQSLIMNEVSNGPAGNQEYVEFVVVSDTVTYNCGSTAPPCIDIRGWIFDDNSGYHGSSGVASGAVRFSQNSLWACVPVGTIILIYNNGDRNPAIPADDLSMSDGNCRIIAPINNTTLFESNSVTPGAVACSYPPAGWTAGGNWNNTVLANGGDCARIVNLSGCEVFSVCWGSDNTNNLIYLSGSASQKVYYFNGGNPQLQSNWSTGSASPSPGLQTPGAPNNAANASYIAQFNNSCMPITPLSVTATSVNPGCTCNGTATASASGSIGGYTYVWYDAGYTPIGQTTATATGLCAGTYHVIGRSSINCTDTATVTLAPGSSAAAVTVTSAAVCQGQAATVTATPVTGGGTYSWAPGGQTTAGITVSPTVTTTYTVSYTAGGCTGTAVSTVTVNSPPAVSVNSPTICAGQIAIMTASGAASYSWNTGATGNMLTATPASSASYTVTGTTGGCSSTAVSTVTVNPVPTVTASSATICPGGTASLSAAGADSYTWSTGATATGTNTATASPAATTSYTITGTTNGCSTTAVSMVTVSAAPAVTVNSPAVCEGQTAHLTASGATSYTWSAGATVTSTNTADAAPAATTSYTVTGTASGCTGTAVATVTVDPLPVITVNPATICSGQTATLTASGAASYNWNTGAATNPLSVTPASTTTYTVTGTVGGCSSSATTTVTVNAVPAVTANTARICPGATATLTATGAATYVWSGGDTTASVSVSPAVPTTYTVTGTQGGCSASAITSVTFFTVIPANAGVDDTVCFGGTAGLMASPGGAGYSYAWLPSAGLSNDTISNPSANPPVTTSYAVTVTDANGCSSSDNVMVFVDVPVALVMSTVPALCNGSANGQAAALAGGGSGTYAYAWSTGDTTQLIHAAAGLYYLNVTDSWGCSAADSAIITEPPALTAAAVSTNVTCNAACNGTATASATGGTPGYSYLWNSLPSQATATATGLCPGTYTCTVTDANSCQATTTVSITEPAAIVIDSMADVRICNSATVMLNATVNGGTGTYSYNWSPATGLDNPAISNPSANPSVTILYTLQVTDAAGCRADRTVTVNVNPALGIAMESNASVCPGASATLSVMASAGAGAGYTYSWAPAAGLDNPSLQSPHATPAVTTTYTVTVTDLCATSATGTQTVTVYSLPSPVIVSDRQAGCMPLCVAFADTAGIVPGSITAWRWSFGDGSTDTAQNPQHCFNTAGDYSVSLAITGSNGCSDTLTQTNYIHAYALPHAEFSNTPAQTDIFTPEFQFINESSGAASWLWDMGDLSHTTALNPSHTYAGAGTYTVWLYTASGYGCTDSVSHTVVVEDAFTFYAPNAFTPDDNGLDDVFLPKGSGWDPAAFDLAIFDRWGNLCFESKDMSKGWDGRVKGGSEVAQMDVYIWKVSLRSMAGDKHSYMGTVTIVK